MQNSEQTNGLSAHESLIEKSVNAFFKGKDKSQATLVSYGELAWLMRNLLEEAQKNNFNINNDDTKDLIDNLWESDEASALTNQAARKIERLTNEFQTAVNERNAAWIQLEEAGIEIQLISNGD